MLDDLDTIALRVHQVAATAAVLAEAARLPDPGREGLSHALYLIEACLLEVEARIEGLRVASLSRAGGQCESRDQKAERPGQGRPP